MIAVALLPPAPAAVGMLKIVKAVEALLGDLVEFGQIMFALGMRGGGGVGFDAAENVAHHVLRFQAEVLERFGGDGRGQKAAHGLLRAAVGIINQVGQRIKHRDRHARRDLHGERSRARFAFLRQIQFHGDFIAAHFAGFGNEFLEAMFVNGVGLFHGVGVFAAARGDLEFRGSRLQNRYRPIRAGLAIRLDGDERGALALHDAVGSDVKPGDGEAVRFQRGGHLQRVVGIVVNHRRDRHQVADHKKARRLQPDNQGLLGVGVGGGDAELVSFRGGPRGGLPAGERIGILHFDRGFAVGAGHDIRLPENRGPEIRAHLHGFVARALLAACGEFLLLHGLFRAGPAHY